MLTISKSLNSSQAQAYHKLEYTSDAQSYYKQGDTVKGEWQGQLSASFGLGGEVAPLEFARLSEGKHPQTEEQMVKHRSAQEYTNAEGTTTKAVEHRAGWDATFSAPKSVSLTALVGGDERVKEAHRAAVTTALSELERYTQARIGGNNPAETTGKFIAAKFEHDTARPVDGYAAPQLHTHAVIFNVTQRPDGSTRAVQPQGMFDSQNYATAVYQSALTYQLRNLGYEIEAGKSGAPEIKGYSRDYLEASSPRSQQIKEQLERTGYSGPEAAHIAAHSTRDRKQTLSPEEVLSAHKAMAADFGNQPEQVIAAARERAQSQGKDRQPETISRAKEAVTFARDSIFEREAVADERAIMRDALRRGMGEVAFAQVRAEFNSRQERGDFVSRAGEKYDTGRKFTTPETIANERANVAHVLKGQNAVQPMMSPEDAQAQASTRDFLNPKQQAVIQEVLTTSDRVHGLQGLAGTGKTTALQAIREGAEKNGYIVEGFAPSSKAAGALRDAGVNATTLQSFLARKSGGGEPDAKHLYMLDESSLASTKQMRAFLDKIGPSDRVLVIGDTRQHQAVDAGRPFQQMQEAGMRTAQLDQIMRQKEPELLKAVQHLAQGEVKAGVQMLADQGRVTEIESPKDRITAIAKDYAAKPENTIIVSPDNRSRQQINEAVRAELLGAGKLSDDGKKFKTLAYRSDMTGADRTWAARYDAGDVLQYTRGSKTEGIERNSFATVRSVDGKANTVTVELESGQSVTYDPRRLKGVHTYREVTREFATADRIQFTAQDKQLGVANRDLATITRIKSGQMTVLLDGKEKRSITFDPEKTRSFDHGYAITSHSSQGLTAGRVIANIDTDSSRNLINTRLAYVAISRASEDARVYTNNASTLGARLESDVSKTAAVDFRHQTKKEPAQEQQPQSRSERTTRTHEYSSADHRLAAVALDYAARPDSTVVFATDRGERREVTQLIRSDLYLQGKLSAHAREVPVLVEQRIDDPRRAANYEPGDKIHYKTGSPNLGGIPHNSAATVISSDSTKNTLTVERTDREHVTYNPKHLKEQTRDSTVFREETREIAAGERIQLTKGDKAQGIRPGDLATVERIGSDNAMTVRMDSGKSVELNPSEAKHIEYGYAVDGSQRVSADRVIATGERIEPNILRAVSSKTTDLTLYTSDGSSPKPQQQQNVLTKDPAIAQVQQSHSQGFGLGF